MGRRITSTGLAAAVGVGLAATGCGGTAVMLKQGAWGADVELRGALVPAMSDARLRVTDLCGGRAQMTDGTGEPADPVRFLCTPRPQPAPPRTRIVLSGAQDPGRNAESHP